MMTTMTTMTTETTSTTAATSTRTTTPAAHRPRVVRELGAPDRFRLQLQGVTFPITRPDLEALAQSLLQVLASVAREEQ